MMSSAHIQHLEPQIKQSKFVTPYGVGNDRNNVEAPKLNK
jgi:hypothetical protein